MTKTMRFEWGFKERTSLRRTRECILRRNNAEETLSLPTVEPVANFLGGSVVPEFMAISPEVHEVRECQELVST